MGLFDQFKQAFTRDNLKRGFDGAVQSAQDIAANPLGILDDHNALQEYGRELQRLQQVGIRGVGVIRSVSPTGEKASGVDWADIEIDMTLPGRDTYLATTRIMMPRNTADMYAPGSRHNVAIDPADPNNFAFAE
ncbi:MAG: hypothetical protein GX859_05830 [Corynebacterium humireducens]|jgi:hypothetical protein|uniref:Uncharacterized protein n=1 Tax=Corynebacterium humireducens TaxID=1223514 RepID=A0A7X6SV48_9CORY|nr:hypothetical protein [Corynebacterium humireducens]